MEHVFYYRYLIASSSNHCCLPYKLEYLIMESKFPSRNGRGYQLWHDRGTFDSLKPGR